MFCRSISTHLYTLETTIEKHRSCYSFFWGSFCWSKPVPFERYPHFQLDIYNISTYIYICGAPCVYHTMCLAIEAHLKSNPCFSFFRFVCHVLPIILSGPGHEKPSSGEHCGDLDVQHQCLRRWGLCKVTIDFSGEMTGLKCISMTSQCISMCIRIFNFSPMFAYWPLDFSVS